LLESVNYEALSALGLNVWQPRPYRHPAVDTKNTVIVAEPLRINARCAVLLFEHTEKQILDGMLSVLNLIPEEVMLLRAYGDNLDFAQIQEYINQISPYSLLQLSMDLPAIMVNAQLSRTFSPVFLAANPQYKAQAYKDLLTLRNILHHGTS
jgi:hypothetical protein